jgi:hypothetical protein
MREKNASLEPFTTKKGPENALNIAVDLNLALQTLKRGLEVRRMHRVQVLSLASRVSRTYGEKHTVKPECPIE